jgi:cobaltochelatase CobN
LQQQQELTIDNYSQEVLQQAQVIVLRLLGGRSYWSYGVEVCKEIVSQTQASLFILPGDDRPDPELLSNSNRPLQQVNQLWQYFIEGGVENCVNALKYISDVCFQTNLQPFPPQSIPRLGIYKIQSPLDNSPPQKKEVAIIFYRSHFLSGNIKPIDALLTSLNQQNLSVIAIYLSSLREQDIQEQLIELLQVYKVDLVLNTTSFSVAKIGEEENSKVWQKINVPILQVILSGSTEEYWQENFLGLSPRDVAMNVALPEVDGRIITRAISFKSISNRHPQLETDVVIYQPVLDRVNYIAELAKNWVKLANKNNREKKVALILANYPNKDGRIANGVGLDTPASCINILRALADHNYQVEHLPVDGDELIFRLTQGLTNDLEMRSQRRVNQYLSCSEYHTYFASLPSSVQTQMINRWGNIDGLKQEIKEQPIDTLKITHNELFNQHLKLINNCPVIPISGEQLGNIFVGIQPSRGYDLDPTLNYHAPDLEPTHYYLAFYYWLKEVFKADVIIHVGKHGNLEWLPGKSLVLSENCYPEITLGTIPHFYPFIINDPGEGSQAKRRANAVILDHLTPPLTRAELYGELLELETLIDEYYQAQSLNPSRLKTIGDRISALVSKTNLQQDLGIEEINKDSLTEFLTVADGYLCELKEAQIRDGLHIFGECPQGQQLVDLIIAIARFNSYNNLGLIDSLAQDLSLDISDYRDNLGDSLSNNEKEYILRQLKRGFSQKNIDLNLRIKGDAIEYLEIIANKLIQQLLNTCRSLTTNKALNERDYASNLFQKENNDECNHQDAVSFTSLPRLKNDHFLPWHYSNKQLSWIRNHLLPNLQKTEQEITNLIRGLEGEFISSGASGAPTRGRSDVLPTGRNFYSVDIRSIPTETSWEVGRKAAEAVIERYTQENGEYPRTLAISVWGTSTMRTGGDDIAQIMALMGVKPVWDGVSRRVVDFEVIPIEILGRPRVDVTVRVSGFFRDGFPNILSLLSEIVDFLSTLQEEEENNPLAMQVTKESKYWQEQGLEEKEAKARASYRLFGSKPGAYGAGLQGLIESQNWHSDEDLARAYLNWSSYAYVGSKGVSQPEVFEQRLKELQIVLHNQDNREHDILDSDDYYQFQGGMTVAVRHLQGENPTVYFGDNSQPSNPRVRMLQEEIARVYRSRVINPKWIKGVMRHGYKGAFEISATVDYLFAYSATTKVVPDFMYEGIMDHYLLNEEVHNFIQQKNPWALRDIAERLIEASQRGLWQKADQERIDQLRNILHLAEGAIE